MKPKQLLSMLFCTALIFGLSAPALAASYSYKSFTCTDQNESTYTFGSAAVGYGLTCSYFDQDEVRTVPLIILKDGSKVEISGYSKDFSPAEIEGVATMWNWKWEKGHIYYDQNRDNETGTVDKMFKDDIPLVSIPTPAGEDVFFVLESRVGDLSGVVNPGPKVDWGTPTQDVTFIVEAYTPPFYVDNGGEFTLDDGVSYRALATNNTGKPVNAHYALVSYEPRQTMWTGTPRFNGQIHFFDIALADGESAPYYFSSGFTGLSAGDYKFAWIEFESKEEMQKFKEAAPFYENSERALRDTAVGVEWMKNTLNITILPVI